MPFKLKCEVLASSDYIHLQQIYTGLALLHDAGKIEFRQKIVPKKLGMFEEVHLKMRVGDRTAYFDMHDCGTIDESYLDGVDIYFKRSYAPETVANLTSRQTVISRYGLNHFVLKDGFDRFRLARTKLYGGAEKLRSIAKATGLPNRRSSFPPTFERLQSQAMPNLEPRVVFMTQVYDYKEVWQKDLEKVERLNKQRAELVVRLRREFGERFFGGIADTDFAQKHFPESVFDNREVSKQANYFQKLRDFPICIASSGLCRSTGWKFAEYVAFAKAIVSERLHYEVDEHFAEDRNYIAFESVEDCLEKTSKLFDDKSLREYLMRNNQNYCENHLRADRLVWNCLQKTLEVS